MTNTLSSENIRAKHRWSLFALVFLLIAGFLYLGWLADRADRQMRLDLLVRTRLIAETLQLDRV